MATLRAVRGLNVIIQCSPTPEIFVKEELHDDQNENSQNDTESTNERLSELKVPHFSILSLITIEANIMQKEVTDIKFGDLEDEH